MSALYVKLSTEWADHPKLLRAGLAGRGLHTLTMVIAKRLETDGWVHRMLLHRDGADDDLIDKLVDLRLLDMDDDRPDEVRPHNWHAHSPSQDAIDATRSAKADAARKGNHKRWGHKAPFTTCPICHTEPQVVAPSETLRSHSDPVGSPDTNTDTESESYTKNPPPESQDYLQPEPSETVEPVVVDQRQLRRTIRLVAEAQAAHGQNPSALAATIRRRLDDPADPDRQRIDEALAAGGDPDGIAAGWAADPLVPVLAHRAEPPRPALPEFTGHDHGPPPDPDVAKAAIAAIRNQRKAAS